MTAATAPAPIALADLGPLAQLRAGRLGRRLGQVALGLALYGVSLGLMVRGAIGLAPWDVLHIALTGKVPLTIGQVLMAAGVVVLLAWIPLREVPGLATLLNPLIVGVFADLTIAVVPDARELAARCALAVAGVLLCGLASALYIGAQLGRGPRDGLMTGLHRRTGLSLRLVRTVLEVIVVLLGLTIGAGDSAIGPILGAGTVIYALSIGPLTQMLLPHLLVHLPAPDTEGRTP